MSSSNLAATAVNIFASPSEAYAAIKERPRGWFPWLLIIIAVAIVTNLYMNLVDLGWFLEEQIRASAARNPNMTEAQIEQAVAASANVSPIFLGAIGSVTSALFLTLIYGIHALYLTGVSFVRHDGIRLGQWFSLICWCSLPTMLGFLASAVNLLTNDVTFMPQTEINPFSIGSIFGLDVTPGNTSQAILANFDVTSIWSLILIVLGYQAWSGKPLASSALIALGPYVLLIGLSVVFSVL